MYSKILLNTYESRRDFNLVTTYCIIMFSLSCIGALYIIYRTYMHWLKRNEIDNISKQKKMLRMSYKLPFYTSCIGSY